MKFLVIIGLVLSLAGCATIGQVFNSPASTIQKYRERVYLLDTPTSTCTAVGIGHGIVASAHHCVEKYLESGLKELSLNTESGDKYKVMLYADKPDKDLVLLRVAELSSQDTVGIWDEKRDGALPEASQLIAMGFPGYFETQFTFEVGYFKGIMSVRGMECLISKDIGSPGYSGPIFDVVSGKLVAIESGGTNAGKEIDKHNGVQDEWITIATSYKELDSWLDQLKHPEESK